MLSDLLHRWISDYILHGDALAASIRVGIPEQESEAHSEATLRNREVQRIVKARRKASHGASLITKEHIVRELGRVGLSDITSYLNPDGSIKPLNALTKDQKAAIQKLEIHERYEKAEDGSDRMVRVLVKKLWLHPKPQPLINLLRYFVPLRVRHEHTAPGGAGLNDRVKLDLSRLTLDEQRQLRALVAKCGGAGPGDSPEQLPAVRPTGEDESALPSWEAAEDYLSGDRQADRWDEEGDSSAADDFLPTTPR